MVHMLFSLRPGLFQQQRPGPPWVPWILGSTWVPATWNVSRKEGARGKPFLSISVAVRLLYLLGGATVMQDTDKTLGHLPISPSPPKKEKNK